MKNAESKNNQFISSVFIAYPKIKNSLFLTCSISPESTAELSCFRHRQNMREYLPLTSISTFTEFSQVFAQNSRDLQLASLSTFIDSSLEFAAITERIVSVLNAVLSQSTCFSRNTADILSWLQC